jgi:hypothetical protein
MSYRTYRKREIADPAEHMFPLLRRTMDQPGISKSLFCGWHARNRKGDDEALTKY